MNREGVVAIFDQIPEEEFGKDWKHKGWFGVCPIYLSSDTSEDPTVVERNWVPEWWLDLNEAVFGLYAMLRSSLDEDWEPLYPFIITADFIRVEG